MSTENNESNEHQIFKRGAMDSDGASSYPRELFPRVTFRDLDDAKMTATVLYESATTLLEECQKIRHFQWLNSMSVGIEIALADRNGEQRTADEALAIYSERLMKCAQLLAAVTEEIDRLQRGSDVELSAKDQAISDQFAAIIRDLQSRAEGES